MKAIFEADTHVTVLLPTAAAGPEVVEIMTRVRMNNRISLNLEIQINTTKSINANYGENKFNYFAISFVSLTPALDLFAKVVKVLPRISFFPSSFVRGASIIKKLTKSDMTSIK